ncbi:MAG: aspartate kinase [Chlamydiae bacterium]|nr:aspartate kinase [Chlamydiota bacterium]
MKFGGASLSTAKKFLQVADIIIQRSKEYQNIVVIVSAMGTTTDKLLSLARSVHEDPPKRELDMLVTAGERISAALLAMALHKKLKDSISFTGSQSGIITSSDHSDAKIIDVRPDRILSALKEGKIVIVAGFQGVSSQKEITTLGRGGSDTSAVALAIALKAKKVEFYKDVEGIFDEDPKKNPKAKMFNRMSYPLALEVINKGAKVLHQRAITLAEKNNIILHVLSFKKFKNEHVNKMGTFIAESIKIPH